MARHWWHVTGGVTEAAGDELRIRLQCPEQDEPWHYKGDQQAEVLVGDVVHRAILRCRCDRRNSLTARRIPCVDFCTKVLSFGEKARVFMSEYKFPPTVSQLIEKQLATGRYSSVDEILEAALQRLDEESDDWAAIKEAIDSLDAGEPGLSLTEAFEKVRRRNAIAG